MTVVLLGLPSHISGINMKLIPWVIMCSLQLKTFLRSFSGDSCMPLTRKMIATEPYKTLYSDLIIPPFDATSITGTPVSLHMFFCLRSRSQDFSYGATSIQTDRQDQTL